MSVVISIANEKGGVGKTTTAINLAAGLALCLADQPEPYKRVLLVDMDPQGHALLATAYGHHNAEAGDSLAALLVETPPPSVQRILRVSQHHENLFFIPGNRGAMTEASRTLPTLMANENRLARALASIQSQFSYIVIDTPPTTGDLLINALVASTHVLIPVETSYLGVSGLRELQHTIEAVAYHFHPQLKILGYLPTLCEEQRSETQEILGELQKRYKNQTLPPIHKSTDLAYAHSSHMDVFTYRPPRLRQPGQIASSSKATQEYASLINTVLDATWDEVISTQAKRG
jgi:chromosome partitioning protein